MNHEGHPDFQFQAPAPCGVDRNAAWPCWLGSVKPAMQVRAAQDSNLIMATACSPQPFHSETTARLNSVWEGRTHEHHQFVTESSGEVRANLVVSAFRVSDLDIAGAVKGGQWKTVKAPGT